MKFFGDDDTEFMELRILTLGITTLLDFVHCTEILNTRKRNVSGTGSPSVPGGGGGETPTVFGPLERANLNYWNF
jgi:hypothetical protein